MISVHRISFELRAQRSALSAGQIGQAMISWVKEQLFRHGTSLRKGGAVAEPWPEENRLRLWKRTRKWMSLKKRTRVDSDVDI